MKRCWGQEGNALWVVNITLRSNYLWRKSLSYLLGKGYIEPNTSVYKFGKRKWTLKTFTCIDTHRWAVGQLLNEICQFDTRTLQW